MDETAWQAVALITGVLVVWALILGVLRQVLRWMTRIGGF